MNSIVVPNSLEDISSVVDGIKVYGRNEEYKHWNIDSDIFPSDISFDYWFGDHKNYPEDSYDFYLLKNGKVIFQYHDCYPEYSCVGYWVENELLNDGDPRQGIYNNNPYNYCKEINSLSYGCLYDSLEDFWNDKLHHPQDVLSCRLVKRLIGIYHPNLSKYNAYGLGIDWVYYGEDICIPAPKNYQHWIRLIYGYDPSSSCNHQWDIFYPLKPKDNQRIVVIAKNERKTKRITWNHGKRGLTRYLIDSLFKILPK
jgi:hypothetical protein